MQSGFLIPAVAHVIQMSVAPVFLLTGVGAILNVLTNRLGRIIDRARILEARLANVEDKEQEALHKGLANLSLRSQLIHWAISLCTICALLVCIVIAALFVGAFWAVDVSFFIGLLFIVAMLALIGGLLGFLWEISLATASVRIGMR
ncbi:MAG TPA: DUF2721 domain-containing protein [Geobacteraceae bacterium]|nr:DUF2721 domain-containing protein [Geobacteraceae bacterium]